MKKLIVLLVLINCNVLYPQWNIEAGVNFSSFTTRGFKTTNLDKNKYSFNGYFISTGFAGMVEDDLVMGYLVGYSSGKADVKFNNKGYQLTNGEVSVQFCSWMILSDGIAVNLSGETGIGWISSNTPLDHNGTYGTASIIAGPMIAIPSTPLRLFTLVKLNIGFIYFSSTDPRPESITLSSSFNGLLSGPEIRIGIGTLLVQ